MLAQPDRRGGWFCCAPWHRQVGVPHRCAPSRVGRWPRHQEGYLRSLPRRLFTLLVARSNGSRRCRRSAPTGCHAGPVLSPIKPSEQPPRFPGTLAHRALCETPITFPAWFPRPSSSVSSRALRTARRQANRLRRYVHLRTVTQPERSPANGFRRRLPAPPTRSVFAPHRRSPSVCQNDNLALKGRIRRSADSPSRQRLKAQP